MQLTSVLSFFTLALMPASTLAIPILTKNDWTLFVFEDGCPQEHPHEFIGGERSQGALDSLDPLGICQIPASAEANVKETPRFKAFIPYGLEKNDVVLSAFNDKDCSKPVQTAAKDGHCYMLSGDDHFTSFMVKRETKKKNGWFRLPQSLFVQQQ